MIQIKINHNLEKFGTFIYDTVNIDELSQLENFVDLIRKILMIGSRSTDGSVNPNAGEYFNSKIGEIKFK